MTLGHLVRKQCGMVTSGIQHVSAALFLVCGGPEFYQHIRQGSKPDQNGYYPSMTLSNTYYVYYSFLIVYNFVLCFADPRNHEEKSVSTKNIVYKNFEAFSRTRQFFRQSFDLVVVQSNSSDWVQEGS